MAELIGACVSNPELSGNKTIEVIASDAIPPQPLEDLLAGIEPEISLEEMAAKQAEIADVRNRRAGLAAEAEELEAQLAEAEERKVNAENAFSSARSELQELRSNVCPLASSHHALLIFATRAMLAPCCSCMCLSSPTSCVQRPSCTPRSA